MEIPFEEIMSKGEYAYQKPQTRLMPYAGYVSSWADKSESPRNKAILWVLSASAYYDAGHPSIARSELDKISDPLILPVDMLYKYCSLARKIDPEWKEVMRFYSAIRLLAMISHNPKPITE